MADADTEPRLLNLSPEQEANLRVILARGGRSTRIDTTTQQIKNCVVAALTECGLVDGGPISVTERQQIAIRTVLQTGARIVTMLLSHSTTTAAEFNRAGGELNAVLAELAKEFGL